MLQNARVTSFTVSELLRENQQMGGIKFSHPHKLGLKSGVFKNFEKKNQCAQNCFHLQIFGRGGSKYPQWVGIRNFAGGELFYQGGENLMRSNFDYFNLFSKLTTAFCEP